MLRCNRPVFNYHGVLKPMTVKQRTSFSFDASSLLLFAALSVGSAAAFAQAAAPKAAASSATPGAIANKNEAIVQAFTKADTNHDGRITPQEAASLPAVAAKFQQLDTNHDGKLSYAEFSQGVAQKP
jgi:hypothetical protein